MIPRATSTRFATSVVMVGLLTMTTVSPRAQVGVQVLPGDIFVADYEAGTNGAGAVFFVNRTTGARTLVSDFGDTAQGPPGQSPYGIAAPDVNTVLVIDNQGVGGNGVLFQVNPATGVRTILSEFGNAAQGPIGVEPVGIVQIAGDTLILDLDAGTNLQGALFKVDLATGMRTLLSSFGNPAQGPVGKTPTGIARGASGVILIIDPDAGTDENGALFSVDRTTGNRTLVSDFGNAAQGATGVNPGGVARGANGVILVADTEGGTGSNGTLFSVNPLTGARTVLSNFGNAAQGAAGIDPFHLTLAASGAILVTDDDAGIDLPLDPHVGGLGALFTVNPTNGNRTLLSDFGNITQGPTGANPVGIAIVPLTQPQDILATSFYPIGSQGTEAVYSVNPATGTRLVLSDFRNPMQGPGATPSELAMGTAGDILVVARVGNGLFVVDPANGARHLLSAFDNLSQGPTASWPSGVTLGLNGEILVVTDEGGTGNRGALFSVDPRTGFRTLLSDFGNPAQGQVGEQPQGVVLGPSGILVLDWNAAVPPFNLRGGFLCSVNRATGARTVLSTFDDLTQGPRGSDPRALAIGRGGDILVADSGPVGTSPGRLFSVNASTGARIVLSDTVNPVQGPGRSPFSVALDEAGEILVADRDGGTNGTGAIIRVNRLTGQRSLLSDFGNAQQGPISIELAGLAVFSYSTNAPPFISEILSQTINEDTTTPAIPVTVNDVETPAANLTLTATSSSLTLVPNSNIVLGGAGPNRTIRITPAPNQFGTTLMTASVSDGVWTSINTFLLTVVSVADPPTISDIPAQSTLEDMPTAAIPFTVADVDTPVATLTMTGSSSNSALVPTANIVFGGTQGNRTVTITPAPGQSGSAVITVTVSDGTLTASDTFALTVTDRPFITITGPTPAPTFNGTSSLLRVSGKASDTAIPPDLAIAGSPAVPVTGVTWSTDRGASGKAEGTTDWVADVPLAAGVNVITVRATDSGGATATDTLTVTVNNLLYYLAEGATGPFFDLDLLLGNPNAVTAPVTVTYLKEDGSTHVQTLALPATSRTTIAVGSLPGLATAAVSAVVDSTSALPILVERSMTWDAGRYGAHTGAAVDGAKTRWLFGEGSQGFFDTFVLLANANPVPANVTLRFLTEFNGTVIVNRTVTASSRLNVWAGQIPQLVGTSFSIVVDSDVPIIAERAMYFPSAAQPDPSGRRLFEGGHESPGVGEPARTWFHAEGATGPFFDTFILVGNPNATPASVTFTYLLATGQTVVKTTSVAANSRLTVNVEAEHPLLAQAEVSVTVAADVPVISERAMYWPGAFTQWFEAHNSFGVTALASKWGLAEGRVGNPPGTPAGMTPDYQTFILLANPNATAETVRVTYLRTNGTTVVKTYTVPATSRFNVWVNAAVSELAHEGFSAVIDSLGGQPIAVERAMYNSSGGVAFAAGTNATAVRVP